MRPASDEIIASRCHVIDKDASCHHAVALDAAREVATEAPENRNGSLSVAARIIPGKAHLGKTSLLNSRLAGENVLVDLGRIAEHDEANVAHVLLRDALHVGGCNGAELGDRLE